MSEPTSAPSRRPLMRGWLHAAMVPTALALGIVLVCLTPGAYRWAAAVYAVTALSLFSVSAVYHRFAWRPTVATVLKRLDHSNIFLIIAGTYTPFAVLLLDGAQERLLLAVVWAGAALGVAFRVLWVGAPRWLYTPIYVALGWVAVFFLPGFWRTGGVAAVVLIATGGVLYSLGALVYGLKRPDPWPRWFGFHEIFHAFTLGGFITQYVAVSLVAYAMR